MQGPADYSYIERAACRGKDVDMFFPAHADYATLNAARAICALCPVRTECLVDRVYTVRGGSDSGVYGGLGSVARRRLMKRLGFSRRGRAEASFDEVYDFCAQAVGEPHKVRLVAA